MRRSIFALTDGVVGIDEYTLLFHQRRHPHGVTRIFHEDQEGCRVGDEAAMQRHAGSDGAHSKFAHAVVDVIAVGLLRDRGAA